MQLKVTILGSGTSGGVPSLGCKCRVCTSTNPKDRRLRSAALIETDTTRILLDCGPDIRQQLLNQPFSPIHAVLITHIHYDHVAGIDDLRPFCVFGDINIYTQKATADALHHTMPYCFQTHLYPGVPKLSLHNIVPHQAFQIGDIPVMPLSVMHGNMPILGFRFGRFAYITDMKTLPDGEEQYLKGVDTLVVNALRFEKSHHSHQLVDDAIMFARRIKARNTFLTHMTHNIGLHDEANLKLPNNIQFAYDGLTFNVDI